MFDDLRSEMPLPAGDVSPEATFQTKDLECVLAHYVIDPRGRLLRCRSVADDPVDLIGAEDTQHHGDVRFHGLRRDGERLELVARFTHGTLEWVRRDHDAELTMHVRRTRPYDVERERIGSTVDGILRVEKEDEGSSARTAGRATAATETFVNGMHLTDFRVDGEFTCGGRRWRCTDIGTRVIVAILLEQDGDPCCLHGPPYAVAEMVCDEDYQPGCQPIAADQPGRKSPEP